MDFATVFTTLNSAEANLVAAQLQAAGFQATVLNEFSSQTLGSAAFSGGVQVQVPQAQANDARELIESTINSKDKSDDSVS